jgi:hypothetical protein
VIGAAVMGVAGLHDGVSAAVWACVRSGGLDERAVKPWQ